MVYHVSVISLILKFIQSRQFTWFLTTYRLSIISYCYSLPPYSTAFLLFVFHVFCINT